MNSILKGLLIASPLMAVVFWYVVSQQSKVDTTIQKDDLQFERTWEEFNDEFDGTAPKADHSGRAKKAEARLAEIEKKEKLKREKAEKFESDFDKAIQEVGRDLDREIPK